MNIWEADKLVLFLLFIIPGFVSLKIYDLIIPGEQRDFSKSLVDVVAYSALNYSALSWLIVLVHSGDFFANRRIWYFASVVFILFLMPAGWPLLILKLKKWRPIGKHIVHPIKKPWDYVVLSDEISSIELFK